MKVSQAVCYSGIGKKRLVRMCKNGELRAYQDDGNKMAWIIDKRSIDAYHESKMPSNVVKNNVVDFLKGNR